MRIRSPSLPELHAFVTSARLGSLAKAAQALYVTPGAVSRAISRVEEQFGQALFVRQGRITQLTEEGRIYLEAVAPAIDMLESAAMRAQVSEETATLQLAITPTLASHWFIRRLPDFQRRHPEITLTFVPYRRDEFPVVSSQGASLRGGDGAWPAGVEGDYVIGREIVPVRRPLEVSRTDTVRSPCELLHQPLLFHTLHPRTWATWFEGVGCACPDLVPAASFEQVSQLLEAAASGLGVALVQRCLVDDYLAAGKLVIAYPKRVMNDRGYYLCYPETLRRSPAVIALRAWLQEQGREHEWSSEPGEPSVGR
jgi:LysR family glycine cleavage system transcriptional activator